MIVYLSLLACLLAIAICIIATCWYLNKRRIDKNKISFYETLNIIGLPIISMESANKKLNFLLDTGSNKSFIDSRIVDDLYAFKLEKSDATVTGINNKECRAGHYIIELRYKDNEFRTEFQSFDFELSFGHIMEKTGVKIDGIIGSDFLKKYKYIINYEELIAYNK